MPVLVTGATGLVGRALVHRLLDEGAQVRAYVRRDDAALRAAGAHVAIGAADDVPRLESALTRAHTIVHLIGGSWPEGGSTYDMVNRDPAEAAVIAAHAAGVRRFVLLSMIGADPASPNELLASKGRAEQHATSTGLGFEAVVFRCAPIWESLGLLIERLGRGRGAGIPGSGEQRLNPIALSDVVSAIVAADSREAEIRGVWDLGGPEVLTMEAVVARVLPGARHVRARGPKELLEAYGRDMVADPARAIEQFGLALRSV